MEEAEIEALRTENLPEFTLEGVTPEGLKDPPKKEVEEPAAVASAPLRARLV
jgi:hypothetical protein